MKTLTLAIAIYFYFNLATAFAQDLNVASLAGKWEYESPKKKSKVIYDFGIDNKFTSTTERKEKEIVVKGIYEIDKKNKFDRLRLSTPAEGNQTTTIIDNYLVKFLSKDTLKAQMTTEKEEKWHPENRRNTMIFIRKKEKLKQ